METVKVTENLQIEVSQEIKKWLNSEEELAAFLEGDTLILKKLHVPKLSAFAETSTTKKLTLQEIVEEVHCYRKEKKSRKNNG